MYSKQKISILIILMLLICVEKTKNQNIKLKSENITEVILNKILEDFGSNDTIGFSELDDVLPPENRDLNSCLLNVTSRQSLTTCLDKKCISVSDVFQLYSLTLSHKLTAQELQELSPALLYSLMKTDCADTHNSANETGLHGENTQPDSAAVWGFGFLFVTIISLCSLVGVVVLPCMKLSLYRLVLVFMVALAVGSLAGSGLLFLIPEAFGLVGQEDKRGYIWRATAIMGGIYLFYMTERIMRILVTWRENKLKKGSTRDNSDDGSDGLMNVICSVKKKTPMGENAKIYKEPNNMPRNISNCTGQELLEDNSDDSISAIGSRSNQKMLEKNEKNQMNNGSINYEYVDTKPTIKPVAWMIIFGDGLHNFIDGLSIGAAFTENILTGMSVSMAVICEELPHELGDFAILLNSGMSMKKALLFNFLSACMCFLGMICGILLGEMTGAHHYIFGVAGGMFLYISLADMMPEMNAAETTNDKSLGTMTIFILQNMGLLTGFTIMLLMAIYSSEIKF